MEEVFSTPKKPNVPKWLRKVQQNSWEPEILLSGLVLIGLMQLPALIRQFTNVIRAEVLTWNVTGVFTGLELVVYVLIFGLIVHLFLRSVWVGLIGLTYTFPKGIQPDKLGYQPRFREKVEQLPSLEKQIVSLEKLCSSIFATCFFLMMLLVGTIISVALFMAVLFSIESFLRVFDLSLFVLLNLNLDYVLNVIFLVLAFDFVSIGIYRKNKQLSKVFYPIHRFIGWITFSRFYRSIYYTFGSNIKRRYLAAFFSVFIITIVAGQINLQKAMDEGSLSSIAFYGKTEQNFFSPYYADRNEAWQSTRLEIPSPIVNGRFLELKLKHFLSLEQQMLQNCGLSPGQIREKGPEIDRLKIDCVNQIYSVWINGQEWGEADWMFYFHQKENRKGFITFVDLDGLAPGRHFLEVKADLFEEPSTLGRIVFLKE